MTTITDIRQVEAVSIGDALKYLQQNIGAANAAKGFHEEGEHLRDLVATTNAPDSLLRNYYTARLALIVTEAAEAIEELRNGRRVDETYYVIEGVATASAGSFAVLADDKPQKPEGVPSELADIVIRSFDFAHEAGFDLGAIIAEKLAYNASRPFKHGRDF